VSEADLQRAIVDLARLRGWTVAHFRRARLDNGRTITPVAADGAGFPDLVLVRDRVVFAELKSERGRLAPAQIMWRDRLLAAGAEWHVWRPADWPDLVLDVLR
jgi:hypothetical protein